MQAANKTWTLDWQRRLQQQLRELGFESVTDFLVRFPGEPYVAVVKRIAPWVAAMQLSRLQMQEARHGGELREAAMDSLARDLNWRLPEGWAPDSETESRAAGALANSTTSLVVDAQSPHLRDRMLDVYNVLKSLKPPVGWRPSGPRDPLIEEAFARAWPT